MKVSIVLPLLDRRDLGWGALTSAVGQQGRAGIEVVAVIGPEIAQREARDPELAALIGQADVVLRLPQSGDVIANEILFYDAGCRRATGELLFFMEGHTVLVPDAAQRIHAYFADHPEVALAWAPRRNAQQRRLGMLVGLHNDRHERRAEAKGVFTLGGNSVIRRTAFDALGGFDPALLRFAETALAHHASARALPMGRIDAPLCTHHNDMSVAHWRALAWSTGHAKFNYYQALVARGEDLGTHVRHPVYLLARRRGAAKALLPILKVTTPVVLWVAMALVRRQPALASASYVLALAGADISGYCGARLESR